MAVRKLRPLRPTPNEAADIAMGPNMNLIPIPMLALFLPHAMILGCSAMNNPVSQILSDKHLFQSQN